MSDYAAIKRYNQFIMGNADFQISTPIYIETVKEKELKKAKGTTVEVFLRTKDREVDAETAKAKEADALAVVRHIITNILGWTPQEAIDHMTGEIIDMLRIDRLAAYVIYPTDVYEKDDRRDGYPWLISRAFPGKTSYNMRDQLLKVYEKVKNRELKQFPRYTFRGQDRDKKLSILLCDYISKNIPSGSVQDLYKAFSTPEKGNVILRKACLYYPYKDYYETPLLYLHIALGDRADDFLFNYYYFINTYDAVTKELEEPNLWMNAHPKENLQHHSRMPFILPSESPAPY